MTAHLREAWRRTAAPPTSWRPMVEENHVAQSDCVILTQYVGRRRFFETYVHGVALANRPTLEEAKAAVEAAHGPLTWRRVSIPKVEVVHYFFGPTDEFSDPTVMYVADLPGQPDRRTAGDRSSNDPDRYDYLTRRFQQTRFVQTKAYGPFAMHFTGLDGEGYGDIVVTLDGKVVASCYFGPHDTTDPSRVEGAVQVHPHHRRKGIASAMYDWIEQITGKPMAPGRGHSPDAEQFWRSRTASYGGTMIARGLKLDVENAALAQRFVEGTVTAHDIVRALMAEKGMGAWWGVMGDFGDLPDFEDYAWAEDEQMLTTTWEEYTTDEASRNHYGWIGGVVQLVLIAERPMRDGVPWDPEIHNPSNGLMGNSYLDDREPINLIEIRYNDGRGWKSLPARGIRTQATT